MIVVPINDIVQEFRKALHYDPALDSLDPNNTELIIDALGKSNHCKIVGSLDSGGYWCTDAIEFPSEKEHMWFLLRWGK